MRKRDSGGVMHDMWCTKCSLKPSEEAVRAEIKERLWRGVVKSTDKKTHNYLWKEEGANLNLFLAGLTSHLKTAGVKSVKYTSRTCMSDYLLHRPVNELIYSLNFFFNRNFVILVWFCFIGHINQQNKSGCVHEPEGSLRAKPLSVFLFNQTPNKGLNYILQQWYLNLSKECIMLKSCAEYETSLPHPVFAPPTCLPQPLHPTKTAKPNLYSNTALYYSLKPAYICFLFCFSIIFLSYYAPDIFWPLTLKIHIYTTLIN